MKISTEEYYVTHHFSTFWSYVPKNIDWDKSYVLNLFKNSLDVKMTSVSPVRDKIFAKISFNFSDDRPSFLKNFPSVISKVIDLSASGFSLNTYYSTKVLSVEVVDILMTEDLSETVDLKHVKL